MSENLGDSILVLNINLPEIDFKSVVEELGWRLVVDRQSLLGGLMAPEVGMVVHHFEVELVEDHVVGLFRERLDAVECVALLSS